MMRKRKRTPREEAPALPIMTRAYCGEAHRSSAVSLLVYPKAD